MKTFKQFTEHHQKDKEGKVIEHGDGTPCSVEEGKGVGTVVKQIARIAAKKLQSKKVKKAIYKKGKEIAKQVGQAGLEGATDAAIDRARETGENIVRDAGKKKKEKEELAAAVEEGKNEKRGAAIGGAVGGAAGFLVPDGPAMVAGEIAGTVAGSKIGGAIGKKFDKKKKVEEGKGYQRAGVAGGRCTAARRRGEACLVLGFLGGGCQVGGERQAPQRALGASAGRKRAFSAPRTVCTRAMTFTPRLGFTPTLTKGCP